MNELKAMYSCVRDRDGELWIRGTTRWLQDRGPGKLPWHGLVEMYGPLSVDAETERRTDRMRARRGWRTPGQKPA